jgi:hypothetical protein
VTPRWGRVGSAAVLGLGLALGPVLALVAPHATAADSAPKRTQRVPMVYHKSRSFRIPFNVEAADRPRLKEIQLFSSADLGFHYEMASRTTPDRPAFTFRAPRDGEYWFTVRTVDAKGNLYPADDDAPIEPSMKVVVDTTKPVLLIEPDGRRGSLAAVRWEVKDPNLDLKSLVLEYQVDGGKDWRNVPITRPTLIGSESWDAGTADALRVRMAVSDKAGNAAESMIDLSDGTPMQPGMASAPASEFGGAPPISRISSGPDTPKDMDPFPPIEPFPTANPNPPPAPVNPPTSITPAPESNPPEPAPSRNPGDPFRGGGIVTGAETAAGQTAGPASDAAADDAQCKTMLLDRPQFPLQYAVDDAGPSGPASVELWVTRNNGRTWAKKADDPDRVSPFPVDLGGEGTFGLRVVARSATGQGDAAPVPGDPPHLTVDIDTTAPTVQMQAPILGLNQHAGKLAILWRASDLHFGAKPVTILWRPDEPNSQWQPIAGPTENTGKLIWTIPANLPAKIHVRVEAVDDAGNRGFAETAEGSPVLIDRSKPKSRIIGLDPSIRAGMRSGSRPMR